MPEGAALTIQIRTYAVMSAKELEGGIQAASMTQCEQLVRSMSVMSGEAGTMVSFLDDEWLANSDLCRAATSAGREEIFLDCCVPD